MKMFVCDYHLNDPTTFLHYRIQVLSAHAQILVLEDKNEFSMLHMLVMHKFKISEDRPLSVCELKSQNLLCNGSNCL